MFSSSPFSSASLSSSSGGGGVVGVINSVVEIQVSAVGAQAARGTVDATLLSCAAQGGTGPNATLREFFRPAISSTGVVRATGSFDRSFVLSSTAYAIAPCICSLNTSLQLTSAGIALTSWSSASFNVVTFSASWAISLLAGGEVASTVPLSLSAQAHRGANGIVSSVVQVKSVTIGATSSGVVNQKIKLSLQSSGKVGRVAAAVGKLSPQCAVLGKHGVLGLTSTPIRLSASGAMSAHRVASGVAAGYMPLIVSSTALHPIQYDEREVLYIKASTGNTSVYHV